MLFEINYTNVKWEAQNIKVKEEKEEEEKGEEEKEVEKEV